MPVRPAREQRLVSLSQLGADERFLRVFRNFKAIHDVVARLQSRNRCLNSGQDGVEQQEGQRA